MDYDVAVALGDVQNAEGFENLMAGIWEGSCVAAPDGGCVISLDSRYDEFHDANKVASLVKLQPNALQLRDGVPGRVWDCPDGTVVWIALDGGQCAAMV